MSRKTPKTRPITLPRTGNGVYVNRETGVQIHREDNGWRVWRPTIDGMLIAASREVRTLAEARVAAIRSVDCVARPEIARAYDEALAEDAERNAALRVDRQERAFTRLIEAKWMQDSNLSMLRAERTVKDELHMEALQQLAAVGGGR